MSCSNPQIGVAVLLIITASGWELGKMLRLESPLAKFFLRKFRQFIGRRAIFKPFLPRYQILRIIGTPLAKKQADQTQWEKIKSNFHDSVFLAVFIRPMMPPMQRPNPIRK